MKNPNEASAESVTSGTRKGGFITLEEFQEVRFQMEQVYTGNRLKNRVVAFFAALDSHACRAAHTGVNAASGQWLAEYADDTAEIGGFIPLASVLRDFWPAFVRDHGCTRTDVMEPIVRTGKQSGTFRANVNQFTNLHLREGKSENGMKAEEQGTRQRLRLLYVQVSALRTAHNTWRFTNISVTTPPSYAEGSMPYSSLARFEGPPFVEDGYTLLDEYASARLCPERERLTDTDLDHVAIRQLREDKPQVGHREDGGVSGQPKGGG